MPQNKKQGFLFGLIMSYTMAIGMEVYNIAIKMGFHTNPGGLATMTNAVFPAALAEAAYMGLIVLLTSSLWGNRLGAAIANRCLSPDDVPPFIFSLVRQSATMLIMCPTMSLIAAILFGIFLGGANPIDLPAMWVGTIIKNFPMALLWNIFAAAPVTRLIFGLFVKSAPSSDPS